MTGALDRLKVVDVSHGMAGNMCGMLLAEYGAQVTLVEPPWAETRRGRPGFHVWNRGKSSACLDLATDKDDAEYFREMVAAGDVLVTDVREETLSRLGITYREMAALNPGLVYVAISGFGRHGPMAELPGYEWIVSAKSGLMAGQRGLRPGPIFTPTPILSYGAAQLGIQGALAALEGVETTGRGERVDTSLLQAVVAYSMNTGPGRRHGIPATAQVSGVMPLAFMTPRCSDGRYIQMCSRQPHLFKNWLRAIGLDHIADDPTCSRAPDVLPSVERLHEIEQEIKRRMAERPMHEWLEIFQSSDVGGDPFLGPTEFLDCEQAIATGRVQRVHDDLLGETVQVGPLAHLSETPASIGRGAPALAPRATGTFSPSSPGAAVSPARGLRRRYPLEGLKVVECAFFYAAPYAVTLMAQLGARVVKVEGPEGDPSRRNWLGDYLKTTAGKESVIADLKSPEGREIIHRLVEDADVFLHNFRPGVPERLGIDYETLHKVNERLIYVYASCYGSGGPWSMRPGFHSTPVAVSGAGVLEAGEGNPPVDRAFGDPAGALGAATAVMLAVAARRRTGQGQYVETTMISSLGYALSSWSVQPEPKPGSPSVDQMQLGFSPLCRLYPTADGWLLLCCLTDKESAALFTLLGDSVGDSDLEARLESAFLQRPASEWEEKLLAAGVPAVRADDVDNEDFLLNSDQVRSNRMALADDMPQFGGFWRAGNCYTFGDHDVREGRCEALGASTSRVLSELGYRDEEIDRLMATGVATAVGNGLSG